MNQDLFNHLNCSYKKVITKKWLQKVIMKKKFRVTLHHAHAHLCSQISLLYSLKMSLIELSVKNNKIIEKDHDEDISKFMLSLMMHD